MSKITNDGLTRSGTGCFIAVPMWQQWTSKGSKSIHPTQVRPPTITPAMLILDLPTLSGWKAEFIDLGG